MTLLPPNRRPYSQETWSSNHPASGLGDQPDRFGDALKPVEPESLSVRAGAENKLGAAEKHMNKLRVEIVRKNNSLSPLG